MEDVKEEIISQTEEEKPKRKRRTKAEIEAERLKEQESTLVDNSSSNEGNDDASLDDSIVDTKEEIKQEVNEEIPVLNLTIEQTNDGVIINYKKYKTEHKFAPNDKVFVAEFGQKRDSEGYTKLINSYKFYPRQGEIERVILTEDPIKVQYKLKNRAGSLFDEEDVCHTEEEAERLCEIKNRR